MNAFNQISFFLLVLVYSLPSYCQDAKTSDQRATPETSESKIVAVAPKAYGFSIPLTTEQIRSNIPTTSAADRFEFLRNQRKTTLDAIASVSTQLAATEARLKVAQSNRAEWDTPRFAVAQSSRRQVPKQQLQDNIKQLADDLKQNTKKYEEAKTRNTAKQDMEAAREAMSKSQFFLAELQSDLNFIEQTEKREADRALKLKAADDEIVKLTVQREELATQQLSYQRLLGAIDDMVNQLFIASDATNSFKLKMSIAFSILVGVVIVGFFGIAWSNEEIKRTIFANDAGIQFITIFSIVIAVILFGIIGVLESKELSALLGGLSGYILGKSRPAT